MDYLPPSLKFINVKQIPWQHHRKHHHVTYDQKLIELLNQLIIGVVVLIEIKSNEINPCLRSQT